MKAEINVPNTLSEITLEQYQRFLKVQNDSSDEEFIAQKMVEIFCGIEIAEVAKIKLTSLNELIVHFGQLFAEKPKFQNRFELGGVEYGFIPELEEITLGEYVDLEAHLLDFTNFHKAMAVMYRPLTKKFKNMYDIEPYKPSEQSNLAMLDAPLDVVIAANVFFLDLSRELLTASLVYLEAEMKKEARTIQWQRNSGSNGDGMAAFMDSLKAISHDLTQLPERNLLNVLPICHLKNRKTK
jgi:hypothetical protein